MLQIEEVWEACTAGTWHGPEANLLVRGLVLMPLNHAAVLLLILVRVGRVMPKLMSVTCTEEYPAEADLIIRQFFTEIYCKYDFHRQ